MSVKIAIFIGGFLCGAGAAILLLVAFSALDFVLSQPRKALEERNEQPNLENRNS
jgi:hypothetical protein